MFVTGYFLGTSISQHLIYFGIGIGLPCQIKVLFVTCHVSSIKHPRWLPPIDCKTITNVDR